MNGNPTVEAAVRNFYELLLICRPKNPISFAAEYFDDEKKTDPEYYHALRVLPFLVSDAKNFRNASATIFGHLLTKQSNTRGGGGTGSVTVRTEAIKNVVAILVDESYIKSLPVELRDIIDASISIPTLGFVEFDIYLRLVVRTSVLLHWMKDLISASCACRMSSSVTESFNATDSYDALSAEELLVCLANPKIRKIVANMPSLSDTDTRTRTRASDIKQGEHNSVDTGMHQALVSAIKSIGQKTDTGGAGITALDMAKEFLSI
jgi:hypothetical protein